MSTDVQILFSAGKKQAWPQLGHRCFQILHAVISKEDKELTSASSSHRQQRLNFMTTNLLPNPSRLAIKFALIWIIFCFFFFSPHNTPPLSCRFPAASWRRPLWAERCPGWFVSGALPKLCRMLAFLSRCLGERSIFNEWGLSGLLQKMIKCKEIVAIIGLQN